jgi:hypothetical protein
MKMKKIGITLAVILLSSSCGVFAQGYVESALLFSRTKPWGSARIQALGGSQVAIGGDYSSSISNPAGLGMFNRSEVTISTGLSFYNTQSKYNGTTTNESSSKLNIPGISLVYNMPSEKDNGFVSSTIAISMSRTNDFNRPIKYEGDNNRSSIVESFIDDAWGTSTSQFEEGSYNYNTPTGLAYYNYLVGPASVLDPANPDDEYFSDVQGIRNHQLEEFESKGSASQWNFSYGANYKDILFLGAGVGITSLKYRSHKEYSETYDSDDIENMILKEDLNIQGTGVNLTLGVIVKPVDFFQFGASFTTPTYNVISEKYNASMSTRWNDFDYYGDGREILGDNTSDPVTLDETISDYSLTTPLKVSAGLAFISKYGFITADIEHSNPAKARYSATEGGLSFSQENDDIKAIYKRAITYRIGIEGRYDIFRLRGGYSLQGNTLSSNMNFNNEIQSITGGVGVRMSKFYIDLAIVRSTHNSFYNPYYSSVETPVVDLKNKVTNGVITAGFIF